MAVHLFGIRHHGPGSARHLVGALQAVQPDIVLIEGPPEGESVLPWVAHDEMKPPVALLAYVPDNPHRAVFYPFTFYSPEWNAIRYGLEAKIPVRFIDMPLAHRLASAPEEAAEATPIDPEKEPVADQGAEAAGPEGVPQAEPEAPHRNPMAYLAEIAGFDDAEEWWEHQFELAQHPVAVFDAVAEAMTSLREAFPKEHDQEEKIREAFMRRAIRLAEKENFQSIAVVCGAWHVPALHARPKQKDDEELLKNLPKTKVETTWVPWTNDRLSFDSGYGAGVNSPGWYQHVWQQPDDDGSRWLSLTAQVFRQNRVDISSAHIIEAVRLSQALAALRQLARPSLGEHIEATQTVMCMGDAVLMDVVWQELIVGRAMGEVPTGAPQVPLQRDFEQQVKSLRLKLQPEAKALVLDLREPNDLQKSILFHRLQVLGVEWGSQGHARGKGTFKEEWTLCWSPELTLGLLEKAPWGNTIEGAANHYLRHQAEACTQLADVTELAQRALPAELATGTQAAMQKLDELAATTTDTQVLMDALGPLVQIGRYGNVRNTDVAIVNLILHSVFYRAVANLPISCSGLAEEQAAELAGRIRKTHDAVLLLDEAELAHDWAAALAKITQLPHTEAVIHGTCCKLLYDTHRLEPGQTANEFGQALSPGREPAYSANWLEGFLSDGATTLLLDDDIWQMVDQWVAHLPDEQFGQVVPLLRRTFSGYNPAEKQKIAAKAARGTSAQAHQVQLTVAFDRQRGQKVFPILEKLLG
jgi:hypothetical protein